MLDGLDELNEVDGLDGWAIAGAATLLEWAMTEVAASFTSLITIKSTIGVT